MLQLVTTISMQLKKLLQQHNCNQIIRQAVASGSLISWEWEHNFSSSRSLKSVPSSDHGPAPESNQTSPSFLSLSWACYLSLSFTSGTTTTLYIGDFTAQLQAWISIGILQTTPVHDAFLSVSLIMFFQSLKFATYNKLKLWLMDEFTNKQTMKQADDDNNRSKPCSLKACIIILCSWWDFNFKAASEEN